MSPVTSAGFAGHVSRQAFGSGFRIGLTGFVRRNGGVAGYKMPADNMGTGEVVQESVDAAAINDAVEAVIDLRLNGDLKFLLPG